MSPKGFDEDPLAWTLTQAAAAIRNRAISSEALTRLCLDRVDELQPTLNAFILVDRDGALAAARDADLRLSDGANCGPLHGVPLAHKDMFHRVGEVTTCGSKMRLDVLQPRTAQVLTRLDAAGAIQLGRLNLSEFALGPTGQNAHHGRAYNPWRPDVITGGSSSGSAAAVAAGMAYGALGSDTGGSIRLPAALCGLAGLKPSQWRVSAADIMPLSPSMDCVGPLARSVGDLALMFAVIADDFETPPLWAAAALADRPSLQGVRIGIPAAEAGWGLDVEVEAALVAARKALEGLGARLVTVQLPDLDHLCELANFVSMFEAAQTHASDLAQRPQDYGPQVRARLRNAQMIKPAEYSYALQARPGLIQTLMSVFEACDLIHMPVLGMTPPSMADVDVDEGPAAFQDDRFPDPLHPADLLSRSARLGAADRFHARGPAPIDAMGRAPDGGGRSARRRPGLGGCKGLREGMI